MNIPRQTKAICTAERVVLYALKKSKFFLYCMRGEMVRHIEQNTVDKERWRLQKTQCLFPIDRPAYQEIVLPNDSFTS